MKKLSVPVRKLLLTKHLYYSTLITSFLCLTASSNNILASSLRDLIYGDTTESSPTPRPSTTSFTLDNLLRDNEPVLQNLPRAINYLE